MQQGMTVVGWDSHGQPLSQSVGGTCLSAVEPGASPPQEHSQELQ